MCANLVSIKVVAFTFMSRLLSEGLAVNVGRNANEPLQWST